MGAATPTPTPDANGRITLTIGSRLELLSMVHALIEGICRHYELGEDTESALLIAVIEAGTNAIQHGNAFADDKCVEFEFRVTPADILVKVEDYGRGFDARHVSDPTDPSNLLDPSGRGIHLMRSLMDDVVFETRSDFGTIVRLRKIRSRAD